MSTTASHPDRRHDQQHDRSRDRSKLARITGIAYLGIIVTGIFAEFVVRGALVVTDDPAATARNIADSPGLFRIGIGADVAMIALDVTVAIGLFRLLAHVNRRLALTTTVLRLIQGAVLAINLVNLFRALGFARDAVATDGRLLAGPAQAALDAVEAHALGYDVGLIAFGLSCVALGRLLAMSGMVSRALAIGMTVTGIVYLVGSLAALFAPGLSTVIDPLYVVPLVVETAFALRLITLGRRRPAPVVDRATVAA